MKPQRTIAVALGVLNNLAGERLPPKVATLTIQNHMADGHAGQILLSEPVQLNRIVQLLGLKAQSL